MSQRSRIAHFVTAARRLLLMQLAAALLAVLLAAWALVAVWELAAERDSLRAQVQSLQSRQPMPSPQAAEVNAARPLENGVRPPAILPIAIPVPEVAPDVNMIVPGAGNQVAPANNQVTVPTTETPVAEPDCSGAAAGQPRCRPGRWNQRVPRTQPEPQPETPPAPRQD